MLGENDSVPKNKKAAARGPSPFLRMMMDFDLMTQASTIQSPIRRHSRILRRSQRVCWAFDARAVMERSGCLFSRTESNTAVIFIRTNFLSLLLPGLVLA